MSRFLTLLSKPCGCHSFIKAVIEKCVPGGVRHRLRTCRKKMIYNYRVVEGAFEESIEVTGVTNAFEPGE